MNALERILYGPSVPAWDLSAGKRTAGPAESKAAYDVVPVGMQGRPQYPDTSYSSLLSAYQRNEIVYAAINRKASAAIGPRLLVKMRNSDDTMSEKQGHPFRRLLMRPNPTLDEAGLLRAYLVSHDIAGRFYAEIVRDKRTSLPVALYPLNPGKIAPIPGKSAAATDYEFRDGNYREVIPAANMLTHSLQDPASPYKPLSPLMAAMGSVDADNAQTDFIRAFFNNGGRPSGFLKVHSVLSQEKAEELSQRWDTRHSRYGGGTGRTAVIDENADYTRIGSGLNEVESEAIRSFTESRISMVFDVPPLIIYAYVGLLRATYSNLKEAWRGFWDATLTPVFTEFATWLTWSLLTEFVDPELVYAERIALDWDKSKVPWLQEDVDAVHKRAREAFTAGGITLNEYREKIDEKPDVAGDYYLRPLRTVFVLADDVAAREGEAPAPTLPVQAGTVGNGKVPAPDLTAIGAGGK